MNSSWGAVKLFCWVVWVMLGLNSGCVVTDQIGFEDEIGFPPSVVSQSNAEHPLNRIVQIELDSSSPNSGGELNLQVIVRERNVVRDLVYSIFLDAPDPPAPQPVVQTGTILSNGFLEREQNFVIPFDLFEPGICHRLELVVVGQFSGVREPVIPGDFDNVTWWVRATDTANPTTGPCQ